MFMVKEILGPMGQGQHHGRCAAWECQMRVLGLVVVAVLACSGLLTSAGEAAENFIPKGYGYSPDRTVLPSLNSRQDRIILQADIVESEIDKSQRISKLSFIQTVRNTIRYIRCIMKRLLIINIR